MTGIVPPGQGHLLTARGNEMFTAMARRHARHALDLGSAEFI
jgi:hypothetical protein